MPIRGADPWRVRDVRMGAKVRPVLVVFCSVPVVATTTREPVEAADPFQAGA